MANSLNDDGSNCMLAGLHSAGHIHLIIGSNPLAATRCTQSLNAGARPILIAPETAELHYGLRGKIEDGSVRWERRAFEDDLVFRLGRDEVDGVVDAVFVTMSPKDESTIHISSLCKRNRIPINVVDSPPLCSFSLLSTHTDGPLQIGVTTNGRGCKLASRIRREIASSLPPHLGAACDRFGQVRRRLQQDATTTAAAATTTTTSNHQNGVSMGDLDDSVDQNSSFNKLVTEEEEAAEDVRNRRMRWLSQVCEYWPLKKLACVGDEDMDRLLETCISSTAEASPDPTKPLAAAEKHNDGVGVGEGDDDNKDKKRGSIILAGSGPGHPHLLTRATYHAIQSADLILADKLVPSGVMDLIPRRTQVHIARKFPGNADHAQEELQIMALEAARAGKTVLRLKQGDPFIYGRGGEEVAYFREKGGFGEEEGNVVVLPGVTSALSAPLFAGIPATQRDVADQVLICTGTGRKGSTPTPPEYVASRTVIFLMALHRITSLVHELTTTTTDDDDDEEANEEDQTTEHEQSRKKRTRTLWPLNTPCAVIERASCPDQRVIRTTLQHVAQAIEAQGSRPPGLLVAGNACEFLLPITQRDEARRAWVVEEGFRGLDGEHLVAAAAAAAGLGVDLGV